MHARLALLCTSCCTCKICRCVHTPLNSAADLMALCVQDMLELSLEDTKPVLQDLLRCKHTLKVFSSLICASYLADVLKMVVHLSATSGHLATPGLVILPTAALHEALHIITFCMGASWHMHT